MKKFTSLFALLAGLCVFSAQAEVTISSLDLCCSSDNWTRHQFTQTGDNQWTISVWDLAYTAANPSFKIVVGDTWIGYDYGNTVNAPEDWIGSVDDGQNANEHNFVLNNSKTGYKTYKVTASWNPNDNVKSGWTLTIEGVDRCTYTVAGFTDVGDGVFFNSDWDATDTDFDMALSADGSHYELTKYVSNMGGFFEFKIAKEHDMTIASYPSSNWRFRIPTDFLYEVKFYFYPSTYTVNCTVTKMENAVLNITDNEPFLTSGEFTVESATYTRNCGSNLWGTLCLPFTFNVADQSNVSFYRLPEGGVNADERSITFQPIESGSVNGGIAVLFKLGSAANGSLSITASGGNVNVVSNAEVSEMEGVMIGTFKQVIKNSDVYYISGDNFYYGTNITINPYRAWIEAQIPTDSEGAPFRISVDDTEGLQFVEQEDGTVKAYYDLQGRKLDGARKGLVIENGKIIMVK